MLRLLILALLLPFLAHAEGTDLAADELRREADGSIVATGNVVIQQRAVRLIRNLSITPVTAGKVEARFEQKLEPSTLQPQQRLLMIERQQGEWKIVADRPLEEPLPVAQPADSDLEQSIQTFINDWRATWNLRDFDAYVAHYAADTYPDQEFPSRNDWIAHIKNEFAHPPARTLRADLIRYRPAEHTIEAEGHVQIESPEGRIEAENAQMNSETFTGSAEQVDLFLPTGERMHADRVNRLSDTLYEAEHVRFTACPADAESWAMVAGKARLDQDKGELTARNARFEVIGIPVVYSPWWTQPLRRKSGLLIPTVGFGKRRGFELALPYYYAPAVHWDATLTPHWMGKRGFMGEAEFRHASHLGNTLLAGEGLHDKITGSNRSRLKADIHWQLPADMKLDVNADHVSDHDYLADYAHGIDTANRYLQSEIALSQQFDYGNWVLSANHQQDMRLISNGATLQILPRLESSLALPIAGAASLHFDQQTTRFTRKVGLDGTRVDLHPYLEIPWELAGGGIESTMQLGIQHTAYWLSNAAPNNQQRYHHTGIGGSLEVRSEFERISADRHWRHSIIPIIRYDYVSAPDQTTAPNFDSAFGRLTWSNLLSNNYFSGHDRIERANRASLLLESSLQHKTGDVALEVVNVRFGVGYNISRLITDRNLQLGAIQPLTNLLAAINLHPVQALTITAAAQYDPYNRFFATASGSAGWAKSGYSLSAGFLRTDRRYAVPVKLYTVSGGMPIAKRWHADALWQYDALLKMTQHASIALAYDHPCWRLKVEGYRLNRPSGTLQQTDIGFSILLDFKGLGSVGS